MLQRASSPSISVNLIRVALFICISAHLLIILCDGKRGKRRKGKSGGTNRIVGGRDVVPGDFSVFISLRFSDW